MNTDDLPLIRLEGAPRERGRRHGELLRPRIAELLERWGDFLESGYGIGRREYVERFRAGTRYERTCARHAPQVLEEVRGIAEGAAVPYDALLAFQHVNEEFELGPRFARDAAAQGEACSTIVVPPSGGEPPLLAQNLDLPQYLDGFQTLLQVPCAGGEGEILVLAVPGMLSLMGCNSFGFAVCDNALVQLRTDPEGVPIFALYRMLLECRSLGEALGLVGRLPHAVGLNWVMGDPEGVAMVERSASEAVRYGPHADGNLVYHTNHPLACADWAPTGGGPAVRPGRSTYLRFAALHQRLHGLRARPTAEQLIEALASQDDPDYPVSRTGGTGREDQAIGFTLACNVFELRRGALRWRLAAGPPSCTAFREFGFG